MCEDGKAGDEKGGGGDLHAVHGSDGTLSRHWVVIRDEPEALTLLRHLVFEHCG